MRAAAVVPVKSFARSKSRLRKAYPADVVEQIQRALLADVLGALCEARQLQRVSVVTGDLQVAEAAREQAVQVDWLEDDPGLNPALDWAGARLAAAGFDGLLVVLGDLPLLRGPQIDQLLEAGREQPLVGVPAVDGGTALLWTAPPGAIPARFGPESFDAHRAAARELGLELLELPGLAEITRTDLDTPDDAERIAAAGGASRTSELLRKLQR